MLFRDIGIAEMEWELESKVDKILKSTTLQENTEDFVYDIDEMKRYAEEVLIELQKSGKFDRGDK